MKTSLLKQFRRKFELIRDQKFSYQWYLATKDHIIHKGSHEACVKAGLAQISGIMLMSEHMKVVNNRRLNTLRKAGTVRLK